MGTNMKPKKFVFYELEDIVEGVCLLQLAGINMGWIGKLCLETGSEKYQSLKSFGCRTVKDVLDNCPEVLEYLRQKGCTEVVYAVDYEEGTFYQHYWL
jgi:hypothetical protein